jgi:hypothetical protein
MTRFIVGETGRDISNVCADSPLGAFALYVGDRRVKGNLSTKEGLLIFSFAAHDGAITVVEE